MALQDTSDPDRDPGRDLGARPSTVLVVGAASRDLTDDDPRGWRLGGAVSYGALALARLGFDVRAIVGADQEAAGATELDLLREAGVAVRVAPLARGPVFVNAERPTGREQLAMEVADPVPVAALPRDWTTVDALFLAPVAGELGPEWAGIGDPGHGGSERLVALGWQGLLRTLSAGDPVQRRPPGPSTLLRMASLVGLSRSDVAADTPLRSLEALLDTRATLAITNGAHGGLVGEGGSASGPGSPSRGRRWRSFPAIPADRTIDATGAGDVLLAALLATRLDRRLAGRQLGRGADLRFAAAAASLVIEGPGLLGVPTLEAILRRAARSTRAASA
jgi:sugar/nucleoside kinase (ribokinase family)